MDLQMPEMNGFDATEYIRKTLRSDVPIIALTADVTTVDVQKCKAVGMNDYISKPVDDKLLYNKIIKYLKRPDIDKKHELKEKEIPAQYLERYTNLDYLMKRTKSNPVLMMEMISLYLEQTPPLLISMKKSMEEKDWKLLHASVHKMIPSFSIMGITSQYEDMAKKIQAYAGTQEQTDEIPKLVTELGSVCQHACEELVIEFNMIKDQQNEKRN
jgi:CheY-like chemotaxis protein